MGEQEAASTLIYLHIPKCAGTSIMDMLKSNYGDGFYRTPNGGGWRKFGKLPQAKRASITCLTGHIPWGLHEHLEQPYRYAVMLRNPVDRITSLYWFCRRFAKHRRHAEARRFSLAHFAASGAMSDLDNGMTRWLAGRTDVGSLPIEKPVTEFDLNLAKSHLRTMVVGFVETYAQDVCNWALEFGWAHVDTKRRKMAGNYPSPYRRIRQAVADANRYDVGLYEWAREQCT